jgi:hypothetical protein
LVRRVPHTFAVLELCGYTPQLTAAILLGGVAEFISAM